MRDSSKKPRLKLSYVFYDCYRIDGHQKLDAPKKHPPGQTMKDAISSLLDTMDASRGGGEATGGKSKVQIHGNMLPVPCTTIYIYITTYNNKKI